MLPSTKELWTTRHGLIWAAWLGLLFLLPVTSQPLLARWVGGGPVSPLSLIPLAFILVFGLLPQLRHGLKLPRLAVPLLLFVAAAVLSTVLAPWIGLTDFKEADVVERGVRGMMTLGIGVGFYLAAALIADTEERTRSSLAAIGAGAIVMLLWSTVQVAHIPYRNDPHPAWVIQVQEWISLQDLFRDRVSGMAYEPSWLADQLVIFYLPLWAACILRRVTAFGRRSRWVSMETILLAWGTVILLGTFSRIGVAAWIAVVGILAVAGGGLLGRKVARRSGRGWLGIAGPALGALLVVVLALALVVAAAQVDRRVAQIFRIDVEQLQESRHPAWFLLANNLRYAERVMYWTTASRAFALHPLLGVGLGNTGFVIREVMPAFGYGLPEMLLAVDPGSPLFPNPKSLWFRLVAETGMLGFVLFAAFLLVAAAGGWVVQKMGNGTKGAVGLASLFSLIALLVEGFSLDSFALPYLWVMLGMTAAGWGALEREPAVPDPQAPARST